MIEGTVAHGYGAVADAFEGNFREFGPHGAACAVVVDGRLVVDVWGGSADERTGAAWKRGTLNVLFSCTKGLLAICALRLVEDGRLDLDLPVSRYWPEFAAAGKGETTVRDLLSHRAGLPALDINLTLEQILDWDPVVRVLEAQAPLWTPGTGWFYHSLTYGWLVGEVIRRITGRPVGEVFQDMVARPLSAEAWIGLPIEREPDVSHLSWDPTVVSPPPETEADVLGARSLSLGGALPANLVDGERGFNDERVHRAEIPGAGGIATARSLSAIWGATVGGSERLLADETIRDASQRQTWRAPAFYGPGPWPQWGSGFQLDAPPALPLITPHSFGHGGAGGQLGFADPVTGVGFGYVTNVMGGDLRDQRSNNVVQALRRVLL